MFIGQVYISRHRREEKFSHLGYSIITSVQKSWWSSECRTARKWGGKRKEKEKKRREKYIDRARERERGEKETTESP
jgi:hypothetical protein